VRLEGKPHPGNIAVGIVQKPLMRHEWAAYRIAGNRLLSLELEVLLFGAEQNVGERSFVCHEIKSGTGETSRCSRSCGSGGDTDTFALIFFWAPL
jgi:hypothetical protein